MEYAYLLIDHSLFINIDINLIDLIYYLLFMAKPFNFLERKTNNKLLNFFKPLVRIKRVLEFTYLFYRRRQLYYRSKDSLPIITSKFYGHCLMVSRLGEYKIINFKKKEITTVFSDDDTTTEVESNIHKLVEARKCNLAPEITEMDINRRYVKECYVNLKTSSFDYDNNHNFNLEVFPLLGIIMMSTTPQVMILRQYQQNLINRIHQLKEAYINENPHSEVFDPGILEFFSFIKRKMKLDASIKDVLLVFSHGDFWEGNVLTDNTKSWVIDWHTLDRRSCYFDFYFIVFDKVAKRKDAERVHIVEEIDQAFTCFQKHLIENTNFNSVITQELINQSDTYRYLFYLEFILLRLQEYPKRDQKHVDFFENWIKLFGVYEHNKKKEISILVSN
ncbi:hypothetical protein ACQKP0_08435 [Heyndrickxia sp. NPDC080065]|uniref:hypothetical protein n=1 Tax=Heyndrickxia sp. NPDC080065 TaxID=3390568 RepID=UPI003CFFAA0B